MLRFDEVVGDRTAAMERVSRFIDAPLDEERIDRVAIGSVGNPNSSFSGSSNPLGRWASAASVGCEAPLLVGSLDPVYVLEASVGLV